MASPPPSQVKQALKEILETSDLNVLTERHIFEQLSGRLGPSIREEHKELVKAGIEHFLDGGAMEGAEGEEEPAGPSKGKGKGAKRKLDLAAGSEGPAKVQRRGDGTWAAPLSATRQVVVRQWRGTPQVDVREYYPDKATGEAKPGKKGIALDAAQWGLLTAGSPAISEALQQGREHTLDLGADKRCRVDEYSKAWAVDLRACYEKDGQQLPTAKGIRLPAAEWQALTEAAPSVTQALDEMRGAAGAAGSASKAEPADASTSAPKAEPQGAQSTPSAAGASSSGRSGLPIELSTNRRADISEYKGTTYVNVREYYEAGGEQKPGKKGIALPVEQYRALKEHAEAISTAATAADTAFAVELSAKRRARINVFKGTTQVDLREVYEKEGKELPGKKGIALTVEQWQTLREGFPALDEALA